jgi:hypothetical protein
MAMSNIKKHNLDCVPLPISMSQVKRLNKNATPDEGRQFKFYTFAERIAEAGESLLSATRGVSRLDEGSDLKEVETRIYYKFCIFLTNYYDIPSGGE